MKPMVGRRVRRAGLRVERRGIVDICGFNLWNLGWFIRVSNGGFVLFIGFGGGGG